jgi:hypothetical protein
MSHTTQGRVATFIHDGGVEGVELLPREVT